MRSLAPLLLVLTTVAMTACSPGACPDGADVVWADAEVLFSEHCTSCHSSALGGADRQDAPTDINFDSYEAARQDPNQTWTEVTLGAMPPAGALSADDKEALRVWYACETPQ